MDKAGTVEVDRKFATSEANLLDVFGAMKGPVHVHLEASELAGWIRGVIRPHVERVVVSHPRTNAWIAKDPLKRDRLDAFKLGELLRLGRIHEVFYPDDKNRTLFKQLVQHYDDVTTQVSRLKVKVKARLRVHGVLPRGEDVYTTKGREVYVAQVPSGVAREAIRQVYAMMDQAETARQQALSLMSREARHYPEVAVFDEAPGVGLIGACQFSAYVQTPHRFSSKRKLWRYCRLGITNRSSDGKPLGRRRLDSSGCGRLKAMSHAAFQGAMACRADNAFKRTFHHALETTHNATHARLTTQRKILAVLRALWLGGTRYQNDKG
jgi:transposase